MNSVLTADLRFFCGSCQLSFMFPGLYKCALKNLGFSGFKILKPQKLNLKKTLFR